MQLTYSNLLVELLPEETVSKGGIVLAKPPEDKIRRARVLQIAPEIKQKELVGRVILIQKAAATLEIKDKGHLIRLENILAILDEDEENL